ncbi:hypothetical protein GALL_144590 [mine drainage metagenome]|uniref:Thiol:disulfide interchange protein DsbD N-terminal domain-containing protein n=1 Tax=mine drainage metagenome TaxID=410659 RepID=A0A1J5SNZ1_9ZZZZ
MKKIIVVLIAAISTLSVFAQPKNPVTWKFESKKKSDAVYELIITATVPQPWHIYSQFTGKGPVPTKFTFKPNPLVTIEGKAKEVGKLEKVFDPNFKSEVLYFSNSVQFVQTVKLKVKAKTSISGDVEFMVCNDEQCLPPTKRPFEIKLQ